MPKDTRHTVEGYWDCSYCGRTGIRGRFKNCPGCGHGRDASVRFYTMEIDEEHAITREEFERQTQEAAKNSKSSSANYTTAQEVDGSDPSLYSRAEGEGRGDDQDGADTSDWYCDYCDSYNPAKAKFCTSCGAPREDSSGKTYQQTMGTTARTYDKDGNLVSERDLSQRPKPESKPQGQVAPAQGGGGCLIKIAIAVGAILVLGLLIGLIFSPKARDIQIQSFDWQRTVEIEQLKTVDENDWTLPSGARLDHKTSEIRSYNQVLDHYESVPYQVSEQVLDHYETYTTTVDNGDGTFDVEEHREPVYRTEYHTEYRDEPVYISVPIYDTKYYYKIERWVHERDVTTSGNDHDPYWGETKLSGATGENGTGQEREGNRTGTYGVTDTDGKHYTADEEFWNTLETGQKVKVMVDGDNHITQK